jgi:hypothetical protein
MYTLLMGFGRYVSCLNPDCSARGNIIVRLAEQPSHGSVDLVTGQGFTDYAKADQKYKCNEVTFDH